MSIQQIAVFVENRRGRIRELTQVLAANSIDLLTLTVADTSDFGILRLITRDNKRACEVLKAANFTASLVDLIGVEVPDEAGGLNRVMEVLDVEDINVEYLYSFARKTDGDAVILFRLSDIEAGQRALDGAGFRLLSQDEVGAL